MSATIAHTIGGVLILIALVLIGLQWVGWLQEGNWTVLEVREVGNFLRGHPYVAPDLTWELAEQFIAWVLNQSLALTLMAFGCLVVVVGFLVAE